jgi:hypothetical protein
MSLPQAPPEYEYLAYIDESGDPGLNRVKGIDANGASEWLILGAAVFRRQYEPRIEGWIRDITSGFRGHQKFGIHFADLNPAKRLLVCEKMRALPARYWVVASNKKNMKGYQNPWASLIPSKNWFYCWMTRLLLERITHFVARDSASRFGAPRLLKIVYSERGGISYEQMNAYYTWLKFKDVAGTQVLALGELTWTVMDRRLLEVAAHNDRAGLHFADTVASAFFKACDFRDTGECDPQFAKLLEPRMGRFPDILDGGIAGYGVKIMPSFRGARLTRDQEKIFKFYGYPRQWWAPGPD